MSVPKPFVGGNWKCFNNPEQVNALVEALANTEFLSKDQVDVLIAPTSLHLLTVHKQLNNKFLVAAQDVSQFTEGAYTGSISAAGLKSCGVEWTLIGHSERRTCFGESDAVQLEKTKKALENGLNVVFCIGETLSERQSNETMNVLIKQMAVVAELLQKFPERFVIAYEPVWSIGTGVVPTQEQIRDTHLDIRKWLVEQCKENGEGMRILYGGSVKPNNAESIYTIPHVNGFLVGGAALDAAGYAKIVAATAVAKL